jgi:hypothetical protein
MSEGGSLFLDRFVGECVRQAIVYEDRTVYERRVLQRRKWARDSLDNVVDIFMIVCVRIPLTLMAWLFFAITKLLPICISIMFIFPSILLTVITIQMTCAWSDVGMSPAQLTTRDLESTTVKIGLMAQYYALNAIQQLHLCHYIKPYMRAENIRAVRQLNLSVIDFTLTTGPSDYNPFE